MQPSLPIQRTSSRHEAKFLCSEWQGYLMPVQLMVAIEPETYDLLYDSNLDDARKHVTWLCAGVEEGLEEFHKLYHEHLLTSLNAMREVHEFLKKRYEICQQEHGVLPFADRTSFQLSRQLELKPGTKQYRDLNPPSTKIKNAVSIYDITHQDMKERTLEWLTNIAKHGGFTPEEESDRRRAKKSGRSYRSYKALQRFKKLQGGFGLIFKGIGSLLRLALWLLAVVFALLASPVFWVLVAILVVIAALGG